MAFAEELAICMNKGGFPAPQQLVPGSVTETVQELGEIEDALSAAGIDPTIETFERALAIIPTLA